MKKIIIALDGYSSCGKSSTAKRVAAQLGYAFIDTGAMYRAVSLYLYENQIDYTHAEAVEKALANIQISFQFNEERGASDVYLNGVNVESEIRKMYISQLVSQVSSIASVRKAMVAQQQEMGKQKGIVMDGRDIGTKVFPEAELKIFMTADPVIRAERRRLELLQKGDDVPLAEILENLQQRDLQDSTRAESPLVQADDAILLDTSYMTLDEQVAFVVNHHHAIVEKLG